MKYTLLDHLRGAFTMSLFVIGTLTICVPFFVIALIKVIPSRRLRLQVGQWLAHIGEAWIGLNRRILALTQNIEWSIEGNAELKRKDWYLVICNHQSWVDILVLQRSLNRQIPFLKFFIKQQLAWMPFLGQAWWALDMPFMRRHSRAYLEKHPEKRDQDLKATQKACEKFREVPTTLVNFVEGTRFSLAKHEAQGSTYRHLLLPRAGGVAYTLSAMQGILRKLLDVTIAYPDGRPNFWQLCCGKVRQIVVRYRCDPIEAWMSEG
ncbi:MAG: acyltransferase, partial [Gammaproteobacteria bacterium]